MIKVNKNKGILFWITGLSGSGKTTLGKKIQKDITKAYGPTIMISGDDIRKIFKLKGYTYKDRYEVVMKYCKLSKFITFFSFFISLGYFILSSVILYLIVLIAKFSN